MWKGDFVRFKGQLLVFGHMHDGQKDKLKRQQQKNGRKKARYRQNYTLQSFKVR